MARYRVPSNGTSALLLEDMVGGVMGRPVPIEMPVRSGRTPVRGAPPLQQPDSLIRGTRRGLASQCACPALARAIELCLAETALVLSLLGPLALPGDVDEREPWDSLLAESLR